METYKKLDDAANYGFGQLVYITKDGVTTKCDTPQEAILDMGMVVGRNLYSDEVQVATTRTQFKVQKDD